MHWSVSHYFLEDPVQEREFYLNTHSFSDEICRAAHS